MKKYLSVIFLLILTAMIIHPVFAQKKISFRLEIDPLIGGGYAGDIMTYVINSKGEIFEKRPEPIGPSKIKFIKKVDMKEIDSLKRELKKADIWEMETGEPRYSGKEWKITIDGKTKTLCFFNAPDKLKTAAQMVDKMLQNPPKK